MLGEFRLVHEGEPLSLPGKAGNAKAPTRTLDVLRALAIAKNHTCSLHELYEWLWPDADGDAAKAACEQALHRLRKLLAMPDVQERLDTYGAEDGGGSREKFRQFIASESTKWAKVVKDGKVKVDA